MGLLPGWSLDLTTVDPDDGMPWDFSRQDKRDKAEQMVSDKKGLLLIDSPMCSAFSQLQTLNRARIGEAKYMEKIREATTHLRFCAKLYQMQILLYFEFLLKNNLLRQKKLNQFDL